MSRMNLSLHRLLAAAAIATLATLGATSALAQAWPGKQPIKLVARAAPPISAVPRCRKTRRDMRLGELWGLDSGLV